MTAQLALLSAPEAPAIDGIDLRCCDVADMLREVREAALVHADPPWTYDNASIPRGDGSMAEIPYGVLTLPDIVAHLTAAHECAAPDAYLLCWATWPKLMEWRDASRTMPWRYVSGGCWHKVGGLGVGFHWRGDTEPLLLYVKGSPRALDTTRNGYASARTDHSEKPAPWLTELLRAFCPPGGLALDLYAGLAPMARACLATGRRYVGAEIDPDRHAAAMARLHRSGAGLGCAR